jgi:putative sigma-54 modulation protein
MQFISKTSELSFTKAMEEYVESKVQKLSRHLSDLDGKATINKEGINFKLEISLPGNIRASKAGSDFYDLVIEVVEQLERQIKKFKSVKTKGKKHSNVLEIEIDDVTEDYDVREKIIFKEEMTREEAIEKMELLGHSFFAYEDIDDRSTCVVYKRNDGAYGRLIMK